MTKQTIGVGTVADDGTGDPLRTSFTKINANFGEVYGVTGLIKSNGSDTLSAASAGTDYLVPQMAANTLKGNNTGATATAADLTADQAQALLGLLSSTTVGYVPFFTGTVGQMGQDGSLFWDNTNKRLGIGTTSPGSKLAVQNSGASDAVIAEWRNTSGNNNATFRTTDAGYIFGIHAQNAGDIYIKDSSDNVLLYGKHGGNVGIGTTSPATSFDVNGPIKAKSYTVATLPSAATVGAGTHSYVTDAMTSWTLAAGGTVAGGGANFSRVVSDGSNWKQM